MVLHLLIDVLRNTVLITGLVIVMMMLIESLNIESRGLFFKGLEKTRVGQVVFAAMLGSIPGCMGGFAAVSLYTHGMLSFGALIAMMIASSGDESFMIIAMVPDKAIQIFLILFAIAVICGIVTDLVNDRLHGKKRNGGNVVINETSAGNCGHGYEVHEENDKKRTFSWLRVLMFLGVAIFIAALVSGTLDHEHHHEAAAEQSFAINLLDETWMQYLFAALSLIVLGCLIFASDHFVKEHLWEHIVKKHLPGIFCWTLGVLLFVSIGLQYIDISGWISSNTALMILLAAAIGIIPESGPHMIFVTLYAGGVVPLPVLLASSISQDGHSSIPLIAENKKSFAYAKLINFGVAVIVGFAAMLFGIS